MFKTLKGTIEKGIFKILKDLKRIFFRKEIKRISWIVFKRIVPVFLIGIVLKVFSGFIGTTYLNILILYSHQERKSRLVVYVKNTLLSRKEVLYEAFVVSSSF